MHAFLRSIAEGYFKSEGLDITSYTFVFPNSRSAKYFAGYLGEKKDFEGRNLKTLCLTMAELFEKGAGLKRASQNRLLIMIYSAYCKVSRRLNPDFKPEEFDRFRFWAEMLLKDFDEIDRYLVDPEQVFRNIADYKQIQSYYLTEEQAKIIRDFWGDDPYWGNLTANAGTDETDELPFWGHAGNGAPARKFKQLWEMMLPIYEELHAQLLKEGLCYPGMACRKVVETLKSTGRLPFNPKKYVFIGFHRLTMAEHIVFEEMQRRDMAHFYWEYDPALMNPETGNKAGRFISRYQKHFTASLPAVSLPSGGGMHHVEVIGIGSNIGQAKLAATKIKGSDTALVLPSSDLLLPLVSSIPEEFEQINVTMGYPLRYSQLSQLYSSLAMLQIRARRTPDSIEYFRNDILRVLAMPHLRAVCPDEIACISDAMKERCLFNLPAGLIEELAEELPVMSDLLAPVEDPNNIDCVAEYSLRILNRFGESGLVTGIDSKAIEVLSTQIEELRELSHSFDVKMVDNTFFHLLERALFQSSLALEGVSFGVLQIMGVLETRALGFKNVMMLSMNDSVFPGRVSTRSFIPESLRRAYGLPTSEHFESDAAYYFFRILSNAENLTVVYDSRTGGLRSGEKCRFIEQLLNISFPGVEITCSNAAFSPNLSSGLKEELPSAFPAEIPKDGRVMERLNRYTDPDLKKENKLSASALKTYLSCPMRFYMERVERINPAEAPRENIDSLTFGNILHNAVENIYKRLLVKFDTSNITSTVIENIISGGYDGLLSREVHRAFNINYLGIPQWITDPETGKKSENPRALEEPLKGEALIYFPEICQTVIDMLRAEPVPFQFVDAERSKTESWRLPAGISLNFTMKIDRIDIKADKTRLVDYKTGKDELDFNEGNILTHKKSGIFQLLTYCYAYKDFYGANPAELKPLIYKLKNIPRNGETFPDLIINNGRNNKIPLESFADVSDWFEPMFNNLISEIFNPEIPFRKVEDPGPDNEACKYCPFNSICL